MQEQILVPHSQMPRSRGTRSKRHVVSRARGSLVSESRAAGRGVTEGNKLCAPAPSPAPASLWVAEQIVRTWRLECACRLAWGGSASAVISGPSQLALHLHGAFYLLFDRRSPLRPGAPMGVRPRAASVPMSKCRGSMGRGAGPRVLSFFCLLEPANVSLWYGKKSSGTISDIGFLFFLVIK